MDYLNEHTFIGQVGNFAVILGFTTALLASISYFFATQRPHETSWKKIGQLAFITHAFSVFTMVGTLLFMLANQYFEYHYVWEHSNSEMPLKYILSSFWEGQEGSTLLWLFWHAVLGLILLKTSKTWESPVMSVYASIQVVLLTMLLGVYIGGVKIGSNPFAVLLREHPNFFQLPIFRNANYLDTLDGSGLNPLLQNYWMTIHPPTLFMGFAATAIPFVYSIAGLWKREYNAWIKPALTWTYFGIGVLGIGILMGGAWAYESLSFGGFWAWDPVENASLVPWLTLVGAGHLMLIQRNKGTSLLWVYILTALSFFLILYSTFLTKSGVLGETSVHAFTDLGLSGQLIFYFTFYGLLSIGMLIFRAKDMPKSTQEDPLWSRQFWMFMGALVLLIAAFQIIFSTSIPVWNKLFGLNLAPPSDPVAHYNKWQLPFAVIIGFILGLTQHLRYKKIAFKEVLSVLLRDLIISALLTVLIGIGLNLENPLYLLLLLSSLYAFVGNMSYLVKTLKGGVSKTGSSIAHLGFAVILIGTLISMGNQETISSNATRYDLTALDSTYKNNENALLMLNDTVKLGPYHVAYRGKEKSGIYVRYRVDYMDENFDSLFTLKPFIQLNNRMGNVAEPSTKHYWNRDIFTFVTYAEIEDRAKTEPEYDEPSTHNISIGDTIYSTGAIIILNGIQGVDDVQEKASFNLSEADLLVKSNITVFDFDTEKHIIHPHFAAVNTRTLLFPDEVEKIGLKIELFEINPTEEKIGLRVYERKNNVDEFIIMKASLFPYINLLWIGALVMALGIVIAISQRIVAQRNKA